MKIGRRGDHAEEKQTEDGKIKAFILYKNLGQVLLSSPALPR